MRFDDVMPRLRFDLGKKAMRWICCLVVIGATTLAAAADEAGWVRVDWVADGDTIVLQDGRHVRYIGIDTPEIDHQSRHSEPMADAARTINHRMVDGWPLRLEYGQESTDRYDRVLAFVHRRDGLFVNAELLRLGCGNFLYRFPNTDKASLLLGAQREAMTAKRGIWRFVDKDENPSHPYRGNRNSKRFHSHDCPMGQSISPKNRIGLKNQWAAFWDGYAPARECIAFPPKP